MWNYDKLTIEKHRDSFWLYPFKLSYYNRKERKLMGTCPPLDRMFSEFNFKFKSYRLNLKIYDKRTRTLKVPLGVGYNLIKRTLESYGIYDYEVIDKSEEYSECRNIDFKMDKKLKLRDSFQENSVRFLVHKDMLHKKMLSLDTGLGKTFCTIYSLYNMYMPSIIISANLSDQWIERIEQYTNCSIKNGAIYEIRGKDSIHKLLKKKHKYIDHVFYIASTKTLSTYIDSGGDIQELFNFLGIGVKIFDEIHMNYSSNMFIDVNTNTYKTFYLTATPERSSEAQTKIFRTLFQNVPVYGISSHNIQKHYNIRLVNYNSNASDYEIRKCFTREGFSAINYFNYLFSKNENILYIFGLIKILYDRLIKENPFGKVIVFIPKLHYIDSMRALFDKYMYKTGNYTSSVDKKLKNIQLSKSLIFSTIGSSYAGLDLSNLMAIINLTPYSSNLIAKQMIGRLRPIKDKEVYYYDFSDTSIDHMNFQRQKRMKTFKPISKSIQEKTFTYNEILEYLEN